MKKIFYKLLSVGLFCCLLLVTFLLNPSLSYAEVTSYKQLTIYHNGTFDKDLKSVIDQSIRRIESSEIFTPEFSSALCLNDGAAYPKFVQLLLGDDVFTAFSNKVVVLGDRIDGTENFLKWERQLNSVQFLSHALMHNLQFRKHGLLGSNPLARIPDWKWEGYVEYAIYNNALDNFELFELVNNKNKGEFDWIEFSEYEGTIKRHVRFLLLVKYCMEDLGYDYDSLMSADFSEIELYEQIQTKYCP